MYLSYYGLNEKPFSISTNPQFLWFGEKHREAFSVLKYGVLDNKGFLLLTGDIGAGKTTLIHALTLGLANDVIWVSVPDPGLELMDFCKYIAHGFKLDMGFNTKTEFIIIFREFLQDAYNQGKKVLLIIDEAQRLTNELLEEIRMLSNIELNEVKLLNIFFAGQIEFNDILIKKRNSAVRQRITVSYHIKPLSEKETGMYIRHRLKVAGAQKNIFSFVAINQVYNYSKGCPRLINIVCDMAMLTGYSMGVDKIGVDIIDQSIESIKVQPNILKEEQTSETKDVPKQKSTSLLVCLSLLMIIGSIFFVSINIKWNGVVNSLANFISNKQRQNEITAETENPPKTPELTGAAYPQNEKILAYQNEKNPIITQIPEKDLSESKKYTKESPFEFEKITIGFHHNSNEIMEDAYKNLDLLSDFLKKNPEVCVFITGYTDELGTYSYNINLSTFRANIVKSYLIGKGVDSLRIKATGIGPMNPKASNATAVGRKVNRRVEIEAFNYYRNK